MSEEKILNDIPESQKTITLTPEVVERIEEGVKSAVSELKEKTKAFSFHGTEEAKQDLLAAKQAHSGVEFVKAIASNDIAKAMEYHAARAKTLNVTTDANGGYLVPEVFETEILSTFDNYSEIISDSDVQTFNRPGRVFRLNELGTRVSVYFTDENSTGVTASTPTFTEPSIAIYDMLGLTDMTQDFLEDQEADIMSNLSRQFAEEMAKSLQSRLINSTVTVSSVVMPGIATVAGTTVEIGATASGYTGVTVDDLQTLYMTAISIDHFQDANKNGKFYMDGLTLNAIYKDLATNAGGRYSFDPFAAPQLQVFGRPVVITNQMPTPATTTSNVFVVYANLREHVKIRRKRGITMKLNDTGTSLSGRNLNYQLGRELVVSQRIGHQIVQRSGIAQLVT